MSEINSVPTEVEAVTWSPKKVWVKLIYLPALNMEISVDVSIVFEAPVMAGAFYPRGKKWAVVIADEQTKGREFTIELWVQGKEAEAALAEIFIPGRNLLIQDVIGINYYAKVWGNIKRTQLHSSDETLPRRWLFKWAVPLIEQERPPPVRGD